MTALTGLADEAVLAVYVDHTAGRARREAAFGELVERYERRVYGITYRYFGNHADAQDASQETFLQLARKAEQFRGESRLSTWVYRVTTNVCHDLGRRMARRPQTPVDDPGTFGHAEAGGPTAEDVLAGRELAHELQRALLELDELSRRLVILCAIEGQSYAEVSEALDLPVGTIKSRVFRARARLAELLRPVLELEDPSPILRSAQRRPGPGGAQAPRAPPR